MFVVLVCLLLLGLNGWRSWGLYHERLAEVQQISGGFAKLAAQKIDDTLQVSDLIIRDVAGHVRLAGDDTASLREIVKNMGARLSAVPQIHGVLVIGADGNLRATAYPVQRVINFSDRPAFRYLREHNDPDLIVGKAAFSRSIHEWIIPVSRRYNDPDGSFGGTIVVDIDAQFMMRFYEQMMPGMDGVVSLFSAQLDRLMRWPYTDDGIKKNHGRTISTSQIAPDHSPRLMFDV